ncbi:hypothetical protein PAXINDRAFT_175426 [Paxillus involutus ATCC 200175]|nr:hypothetical protein PAXINDRAFT_175426 [Paxillus involutus ATCC 200175]
MGSVTPRASGFWTVSTRPRMSYFGGDDVEEAAVFEDEYEYDGRTPLDKTIDRIGMGSYQWTLLSLCGFGWMADNMWIQAIAIILPRVQQHYSVPDSYIGTLSSSMFAGMMVGAIGWGSCSDLVGRSAAFNATLFFTAVFGMLASFAQSFWMLCAVLFFLGSAVGGSMPTDGTLLLEHMPKGKQYLVTALSVFFSFGSVLSAVVALFVLPKHSCPPNQPCDPSTANNGWKYMLVWLGLITLSMFLARIVFFRLHESPRYLVHAGRHQEALESLQLISRFNGSEIPIDLEDVDDRRPPEPQSQAQGSSHSGERAPFLPPAQETLHPNRETLFDAHANADATGNGAAPGDVPREDGVKDYQSTDESPNSLDSHLFITPIDDHPPQGHSFARGDIPSSSQPKPLDAETKDHTIRHSRYRFSQSLRSQKRARGMLPRWINGPLVAWLDRIAMTGSTGEGGPPASLEDNLWDVVIFTLGGCPGAILGAYMVESSLGRRGSLAGTTLLTAFFCMVFVHVKSPFMVRASSVGISLSATTMYAVLYGWTPEIFGTKVRGTACGIASALSRIGGMIAPLLGGALLVMDRSFPVYTSVVVYLVSTACVLLLHETAGQGGEGAFIH